MLCCYDTGASSKIKFGRRSHQIQDVKAESESSIRVATRERSDRARDEAIIREVVFVVRRNREVGRIVEVID